MEIHDRLRIIIEDEGLSVSRFEKILGVGPNSISTCLRRRSSISHHVLLGVKKHFPHYSMDWLLTGKESNNKEVKTTLLSLLKEVEEKIKAIQ